MRTRYLTVCFFLCVACGDDSEATDTGSDVGMDTPVDARPDAEACDEGEPCDADGDGCTRDLCRRGECRAGPPAPCDDGNECTIDTCVSTSELTFSCQHEIASNSCVIGGACFADGTANPENSCQICDPSTPQAWSTQNGSCDDGDMCTINDSCATGTCTGDPRIDAFEPNPFDAPSRLPNVRDNQSFPAGDLTANLFPDGDVDFYTFFDEDVFGGSIFPRVELSNISSGLDLELCAYADCAVECEIGQAAELLGRPGCCSNNAGNSDETVRLNPNCSGTNDSVNVLIRVRSVGATPGCDDEYTLAYGDD